VPASPRQRLRGQQICPLALSSGRARTFLIAILARLDAGSSSKREKFSSATPLLRMELERFKQFMEEGEAIVESLDPEKWGRVDTRD